MSNWISISTDDFYDYLAAEQAAALQSEALGDGQTDPLPTIIADVVERIRAEVRGNSANVVDETTGTIPPELRGAAMALIVEAAQARLPTLEMSDDQIRLANAARTLLTRVASGDVDITEGEAETTPGIVLVKSRMRAVTGKSLIGL